MQSIKVDFLNLKYLNNRYRKEIIEKLERVLDSGKYILDEELFNFEEDFSKYCGAKHAIGVANGLDALFLSLRAWKEMGLINDGDEVIVPANTYIASILAISNNGLKPVLVEPDYETMNISPKEILNSISKKTKAILAVHLYGGMAPIMEIKEIALNYGLLILEDAAQAHGASINGIKAGAWGDAGAFSFYPGKNLGAIGDAGMIISNDGEFSSVVRSLRNYGSLIKYQHEKIGFNSRLDEIQAAVLSVKLKYLDRDNYLRRKIAHRYFNEIKLYGLRHPVKDGNIFMSDEHVFHLYAVKTPFREDFSNYLSRHGIQTMIHYPIPPHKQNAYREYSDFNYPVTERIHREVISLPLNPVMMDEEVDFVIETCNKFDVKSIK